MHHVKIESKVAEAVGAVIQTIAKTDSSPLEAVSHSTDRHLASIALISLSRQTNCQNAPVPGGLVTKMISSGKQLRTDGIWIVDDLSN